MEKPKLNPDDLSVLSFETGPSLSMYLEGPSTPVCPSPGTGCFVCLPQDPPPTE